MSDDRAAQRLGGTAMRASRERVWRRCLAVAAALLIAAGVAGVIDAHDGTRPESADRNPGQSQPQPQPQRPNEQATTTQPELAPPSDAPIRPRPGVGTTRPSPPSSGP